MTTYAIFLPKLLRSAGTNPSCSKCCKSLKQGECPKPNQLDLVKIIPGLVTLLAASCTSKLQRAGKMGNLQQVSGDFGCQKEHVKISKIAKLRRKILRKIQVLQSLNFFIYLYHARTRLPYLIRKWRESFVKVNICRLAASRRNN